jgi:hypothetical protein
VATEITNISRRNVLLDCESSNGFSASTVRAKVFGAISQPRKVFSTEC